MQKKKGGLCFLERSADFMVQGIAEKKGLTKRSQKHKYMFERRDLCQYSCVVFFHLYKSEKNAN